MKSGGRVLTSSSDTRGPRDSQDLIIFQATWVRSKSYISTLPIRHEPEGESAAIAVSRQCNLTTSTLLLCVSNCRLDLGIGDIRAMRKKELCGIEAGCIQVFGRRLAIKQIGGNGEEVSASKAVGEAFCVMSVPIDYSSRVGEGVALTACSR
jgi:hypothetical protein